MAAADPGAFTVATSAVVADAIRSARGRLVVVCPALWDDEARALSEVLQTVPPNEVVLIFDASPEVFRLGYGDVAAQELAHAAARERGVEPRWQPGVRIGMVIADDQTLVFTPVPRLVEAGPNTTAGANAIRLGPAPKAIEAELGGTGEDSLRIGRQTLSPGRFEETKAALKASPPQAFDVARQVVVFNAFIEFVEIEVRGTELSRRTFRIPPFLLAVADSKVREQLKTSYSLQPDKLLDGSAVERDRKLLTSKFLRVIPRYGTVVLRKDKDDLIDAIEELADSVKAFGERARSDLQAQIDKTVAELKASLLPGLLQNPPAEWTLLTGRPLDKGRIEANLEAELRAAFGSAANVAAGMSVHHRFKGVTHEMLRDKAFIAAARKAVPELESLYLEFSAAAASRGNDAS